MSRRVPQIENVKAIVDGYGGSITPGNNEAGGAMFEIRLPAA